VLNTVLSNIQELIEKSIYSQIMGVSIANGYTPNLFDTVTYPNTPTGQIALQSALDAIIVSKGFTVEVLSNNAPQDKGYKKSPRIVIVSENFISGQIGAGIVDYEEVTLPITGQKVYYKYLWPSTLSDFSFQVHIIANSVTQERVLNSIVANALPTLGYIPIYNGGGNFFIRNIGYSNLGNIIENLIEKVNKFTIEDVYLTEKVLLLNNNISPLKESKVDLELNSPSSNSPLKETLFDDTYN